MMNRTMTKALHIQFTQVLIVVDWTTLGIVAT